MATAPVSGKTTTWSTATTGFRFCTAARPVHLAIMDGVKTMAGAQTPDPWCTPVEPGVLMAGTNVVNTAAVAVAAMNYNPRALEGTVPFERSDNKLLLAEQLGVGSADPRLIEVIGPSIQEVLFDFRAQRPFGGRGTIPNQDRQ